MIMASYYRFVGTRGNGTGRKAEHMEEHGDVIVYNGGERCPDSSKIDNDFIIQQC